jgi:hypothetical protein
MSLYGSRVTTLTPLQVIFVRPLSERELVLTDQWVLTVRLLGKLDITLENYYTRNAKRKRRKIPLHKLNKTYYSGYGYGLSFDRSPVLITEYLGDASGLI